MCFGCVSACRELDNSRFIRTSCIRCNICSALLARLLLFAMSLLHSGNGKYWRTARGRQMIAEKSSDKMKIALATHRHTCTQFSNYLSHHYCFSFSSPSTFGCVASPWLGIVVIVVVILRLFRCSGLFFGALGGVAAILGWWVLHVCVYALRHRDDFHKHVDRRNQQI